MVIETCCRLRLLATSTSPFLRVFHSVIRINFLQQLGDPYGGQPVVEVKHQFVRLFRHRCAQVLDIEDAVLDRPAECGSGALRPASRASPSAMRAVRSASQASGSSGTASLGMSFTASAGTSACFRSP
ncbi:hypothetical protein ABIE57_003681 [Roseovarius sp. MBR-6]